jgi:hypothetical protein
MLDRKKVISLIDAFQAATGEDQHGKVRQELFQYLYENLLPGELVVRKGVAYQLWAGTLRVTCPVFYAEDLN